MSCAKGGYALIRTRAGWEEDALSDLEGIYAYIAQDNPEAAAETAESITEAVGRLEAEPGVGRPGRVPP